MENITLPSLTRIIPIMHKSEGELLFDVLKIHALADATKILDSYILVTNHNANFMVR